jgi:hypothetical protein
MSGMLWAQILRRQRPGAKPNVMVARVFGAGLILIVLLVACAVVGFTPTYETYVDSIGDGLWKLFTGYLIVSALVGGFLQERTFSRIDAEAGKPKELK